MEHVLSITNFKNVSFGSKIIVKGKVAQGAKRFAINLGKDISNFLIHFNARFDDGVILCNYKIAEKFGPEEKRISPLPFKKGEEVAISFLFESKQVRVYCPEENIFVSKLNLDRIEYLSVDGDFKVHSIVIE